MGYRRVIDYVKDTSEKSERVCTRNEVRRYEKKNTLRVMSDDPGYNYVGRILLMAGIYIAIAIIIWLIIDNTQMFDYAGTYLALIKSSIPFMISQFFVFIGGAIFAIIKLIAFVLMLLGYSKSYEEGGDNLNHDVWIMDKTGHMHWYYRL